MLYRYVITDSRGEEIESDDGFAEAEDCKQSAIESIIDHLRSYCGDDLLAEVEGTSYQIDSYTYVPMEAGKLTLNVIA